MIKSQNTKICVTFGTVKYEVWGWIQFKFKTDRISIIK